MDLANKVEKHYGHRLRLRLCGICIQDNKLLLVQHQGLGSTGILWAPPGGGAEYGSTSEHNLAREFREETGLTVTVGDFMFVHEYLAPPLHAVELFFEVNAVGGALITGTDPEVPPDAQLIRHVSFKSWQELKQYPPQELHQILNHCSSLQHLKSLRGYYNFSV